MANFEVNFPEDAFGTLLKDEDILKEMVEAAAPVMDKAVKKQLTTSIGAYGGKYSRGEMLASVKTTKAKKTKTDAVICVTRPTGKDKKGVRNAAKAFYMEYGTSKQSAHPWLDTATKNAEPECIEAMQKVFNKKAGL